MVSLKFAKKIIKKKFQKFCFFALRQDFLCTTDLKYAHKLKLYLHPFDGKYISKNHIQDNFSNTQIITLRNF